MNTLRSLLVLLLVVALPWSASATMRENLRCHHDGLGTLIDGAPQHDHAAVAHHGQNADQGCDCEVKCHCQHHCASGTGIAGLVLVIPTLAFASGAGGAAAPYAAWIPSIQDASPFRPPIAAPPGAA